MNLEDLKAGADVSLSSGRRVRSIAVYLIVAADILLLLQ